MHRHLSDLDCIVKPLCMSRHLTDPNNYHNSITYPEEFMVLEYAEYGSLHELIQFTKSFTETTAFAIFNQILQGVHQIHKKGVVHMDIKENNILITHCDHNQQNPMTGYLPVQFKLADFGISISVNREIKVFYLCV